ncbi:MAG TPA: BTAD domain-containing putative transcriptional regulator [Blastocatellia bacterium]|nr:BTAD domain-containing putative transcriptional regulator [Blastocatellia bacterium]
MISTLEIHLLGPFRVAVDGSPVESRRWSRRSAALLVKLLALQPHHQLHREQVMELLWPELDLHSAANNLHKTIHAARRALQPDLKSGAGSHFIITQAQQILLRAPDKLSIDADDFEQQAIEAINGTDTEKYETALGLYEGDLLIEDLYEDWAAIRREQLRALHQDLLINLARLHEARGQHRQGIERLKESLACDQSNEEAHRQLMRLYAETGSRHQALQQYQQCRDAVRKELDSEPDQTTIELYEKIVAGQIKRLSSSKSEPDTKAIDSLAILPLVNDTDAPEAEYLSDGITESIINGLSQLRQLRVMARSTVFRYKAKEVDPQTVGRELGVRAVMTGRVLHLGETLIIRTELVDVADGSQLWGEQYNRRLADIFAVQEEISREITEKLRLQVTGEDQKRLAKRYTENTEAYHAYLKGRYYWNKRTAEWLKKGADSFKQAIAIDPGYALAYAGLSDSYTLLVIREAMPPSEGFAKAKAAAAMALKIDDSLGEAHASLAHAMLHNWEWKDSEMGFRRSIELNPGYASARHWYSEYLYATGHLDEAIEEVKRAIEFDPLSLIINAHLGDVLYHARQYDQSIEQNRKVIEMDSSFAVARMDLGRAYGQIGMYEEAIAELKQTAKLFGDSLEGSWWTGLFYAAWGKTDEARAVLDELKKESNERHVSPYGVALIHTALGEKDQAFEWLEKAYEAHDGELFNLKVEPSLDPLRRDSRFTDLLRRVGLAP